VGVEQGDIEQSLGQQPVPRGAAKEVFDVLQGKAVHGAQGEDDAIVQCRSLELEIEGAVEPLAQGQSPGAVEARAVRRMHHQMHVADFIEEAFEDDAILGGDAIIGQQLVGRRGGQAIGIQQPGPGLIAAGLQPLPDPGAQLGDARRE